MPPLVFICFSENSGHVQCLLLKGDQAQEFLRDARAFMKQFSKPALLGSWEVPDDLKNASASGSVGHAFRAILGLDALAAGDPVVSDLLATVFRAGYHLAHKHRHTPVRKHG